MLNVRNVFKQFQRIGGGEIEDVVDAVSLVADGESFGIVATAAAEFAGDVNIGQEIHFDAAQAFALAGFAAATFDVEAEAARLVAAFAGFRKHGEKLAYRGEDTGVGGGIGTRSATDGGLIDLDDFVDVLDTENHFVCAGRFLRAIEFLGEGAIEDVVDEGGFTGTGDTGDDREQA